MAKLIIIVETPNFSARAKRLLSEALRQEIAIMVAEDPTCGDLLVGTGGCRKARIALPGRGKSGSVRFVYLHCGDHAPTFLRALFAKNEKTTLPKVRKISWQRSPKIFVEHMEPEL